MTGTRIQAKTKTKTTAARQRKIQQRQDRSDQAEKKTSSAADTTSGKPAQTTTRRRQPAPPMPTQHLRKPGSEAEMVLPPRYEAPLYRGSDKLAGKVALITGGDSGIGRAVAVLFAREGARVAIAYLAEEEDARTTAELVEREGGEALTISGDVRDPAFCRRAVKKTVTRFGRLDILVNNAAFQEHAASLDELTPERLDETLRTNVHGYFYMARAALAHMGRGAVILNTGSVTGLRGSDELLDYAASKGAIHAFTLSLASNVLARGIRVNAIAPGPVWTPLNPADKSPQDIRCFGAGTDIGRPAQPEEIAPAYVFLAADACASYITGIVLPITGSVGD